MLFGPTNKILLIFIEKKAKWVSLCCTVLQFEFNNIISMYKKNDSVRSQHGYFLLYLITYY